MTNISHIGEFDLIERIKRRTPKSKNILIGIGDDAAILKKSGRNILLTTDLLVENVDFSFKTAMPEQIGRKALAVNLSDVAAMGGIPKTAVIGLVVPPKTDVNRIERFYQGLLKLAKQFKVSIAGGDLSKGPLWMVSVTLLGEANRKSILRSGAKAGDLIGVTGKLGGSIRGKHLNFIPRVEEGKFLADSGIHSMIDISDGFLQDLGHILRASKTGALVALDHVPISKDAKTLDQALSDGEDFELLFTASPAIWKKLEPKWKKRFRTPLFCVGMITRIKNQIMYLQNGRIVTFKPKKAGYQHFS